MLMIAAAVWFVSIRLRAPVPASRPADVNGVTGTPGSPDVGLAVGLSGGLQALYRLPLVFPAAGGAILPSYEVGAPVKSSFTFDLNQDIATAGAACFVNTLFRNLSQGKVATGSSDVAMRY